MSPDKVILIYKRQWKNSGYSPETIFLLTASLKKKIDQEIYLKKMTTEGTRVVTH
jgi:hypothetical protein